MTVALRPFQQKIESDTYAAWDAGAKNVMVCAATGSGKTVVLSKFLLDEAGASIAIAHRQELVSQISVALARNGVRHRLVGAKKGSSLIRIVSALQIAEMGYSFFDPNARTGVGGVDTIIRMDENDPWFKQVRLMVQDEAHHCCPAGTMVSGKPIESIKVGDTVDAYDEANQTFVRRAVTHTFKHSAPKYMMRINSTHHVLECTKGHPILTRSGWKDAIHLTLDDEILLYVPVHELQHSNTDNQRSAALSIEKERFDILRPNVRLRVSYGSSKEARESRATDSQMSYVRKSSRFVRTSTRAMAKNRTSVLHYGLLKRVSSASCVAYNECDQSNLCERADASKQSDVYRNRARKNDSDIAKNRTLAKYSWWQRCSNTDTRINIKHVARVSRVHSPICYKNESMYYKPEQLPAVIQTRLCEPRVKNCDRSGRFESLVNQTSSVGCEKGYVSKWVRLDSIAIYERSNHDGYDDGFVYNLEVDEHHTFVANGIVTHNCLRENKWGAAARMFPNARGLLPTATPLRADGKGLGRKADGIVDYMVLAPSMREIIDMGYLTDYRIYAPPSDVNIAKVKISQATGDFNAHDLRKAVHESRTMTGDIVGHYLKLAKGKLGVTFAVDVEAATEIAAAFRAAGVPAETVSAKTPDSLRAEIIARFKRRELLQLVNVDLFGEGFDLPAIEVVSFARHTQSFSLYCQQFGRALRLMLSAALLKGYNDLSDEGRRARIAASEKPVAIIIDHVGNVIRHGLPDAPQNWSLDARDRRGGSKSDAIPLRVCLAADCMQPYERIHKNCPWCGHYPEPALRSAPEHVDGDLTELDPDVLRAMRGEIARIDGAATIPWGASPAVEGSVKKQHWLRQQSQHSLREVIAWWAGYENTQGRTESESYRRFYHRFGVDIASCMTYGAREANELNLKITLELAKLGVIVQ